MKEGRKEGVEEGEDKISTCLNSNPLKYSTNDKVHAMICSAVRTLPKLEKNISIYFLMIYKDI